MPLLFVFVVYVPTKARNQRFAGGFCFVAAPKRTSAGAARISRNAKNLRVIFMRLKILASQGNLLFFFFVFFLQHGGGGDGIVILQPQQAYALGRAAGLADFV